MRPRNVAHTCKVNSKIQNDTHAPNNNAMPILKQQQHQKQYYCPCVCPSVRCCSPVVVLCVCARVLTASQLNRCRRFLTLARCKRQLVHLPAHTHTLTKYNYHHCVHMTTHLRPAPWKPKVRRNETTTTSTTKNKPPTASISRAPQSGSRYSTYALIANAIVKY